MPNLEDHLRDFLTGGVDRQLDALLDALRVAAPGWDITAVSPAPDDPAVRLRVEVRWP